MQSCPKGICFQKILAKHFVLTKTNKKQKPTPKIRDIKMPSSNMHNAETAEHAC